MEKFISALLQSVTRLLLVGCATWFAAMSHEAGTFAVVCAIVLVAYEIGRQKGGDNG